MSERLETLNKARARMLEERDVHAKVLAAPFDRDKAERVRNKFIEIQILIDARDRDWRGGDHRGNRLNWGLGNTPLHVRFITEHDVLGRPDGGALKPQSTPATA